MHQRDWPLVLTIYFPAGNLGEINKRFKQESALRALNKIKLNLGNSI
jgi:hypothetical protein